MADIDLNPAGPVLRSLTDILSEGRALPDGWDMWGWKVVRPDLTTRDGFRWPWPGNVAEVTDPEPGPEVCCRGLHIALKPAAMLGYGPTVLLLAYRQADVIAADTTKCRVSRAFVVDVIDLPGLGRAGKLTRADLGGAYLGGADLGGADLTGAYLTGAYLTGADLTGAYLTRADLTRADLTRADLTRADLTRADLTRAYLTGAYLTGAYLTGAHLRRDQLTGAQQDQIAGTPNWIED